MEIKNFKPKDKGALIGTFDIFFEKMGMTIREVALFKNSSNMWLSFPARQYKDQEGQTKYYSYVMFDKDNKEKFEQKCFELLKPHLTEPSPKSEPNDGWF